MYFIWCDEFILHDPRLNTLQVISPKCSLQLNKTGKLEFKIAPNHPNYNNIHKHMSEITLLQDEEVLFCGRVLNDEIDFYNMKNIECEGDLSYLLDSIQRSKEYHLEGGSSNVIEVYFNDLINIHNSQVDSKKQFNLGNVTVTDPNNYLYRVSNYNNTLECVNDKLVDTYGGYIQVRHKNGIKYIDYLADLNNVCSQKIEFGKNLIDMTKYVKGEDIFTALIPLGAKIEDEEEETRSATETYVDISNIPDSVDGTIVKENDYIYDSQAVENYGWIWKTEKWSDVTVDSNLFSKGKELLKNSIQELLNIELTAVDLHLLDVSIDDIKLGDKIQIVSIPHNLNLIMIVEKLNIDITNPSNTKITLSLPSRFIKKDTSMSNNNKVTDKKIKEVTENLAHDFVNFNDIKNLDEKYFHVDPLDDIKSVPELKEWVSDNHIKTVEDEPIKTVTDIKDWTSDNHLKLTPSDTVKSVDDMKNWTSNNHLKLTPADSIKSVGDLKQWASDNFASKTAGGSIDLSEYAKIVDVNNAFNQLASALGGV